jgi:hypothetical protein
MWLIELFETPQESLRKFNSSCLDNRFYAFVPKNNRFYAEKIDFERYSPFIRLFNLSELLKGV